MSTVTLGGERLGSGNKNKVHLRNYERSTHDLGYTWRSTMAAGTLVPFMSEVALPGDTFSINLSTVVLTHPTIGPLFGSYKVQLDVFQVPIRLYQGQLHMNKLGIGLKMSDVKLPLIKLEANNIAVNKDPDNTQVNPSSIFSYLNIRGLGYSTNDLFPAMREFNAVPYLGYWDIYKNYYANKQEEIGAVIHNNLEYFTLADMSATFTGLRGGQPNFIVPESPDNDFTLLNCQTTTAIRILATNAAAYDRIDVNRISLFIQTDNPNEPGRYIAITDLFVNWIYDREGLSIRGITPNPQNIPNADSNLNWQWWVRDVIVDVNPENENDLEPQIKTFPLENIDNMRELILKAVQQGSPFMVDQSALEPYVLPLKKATRGSVNLYSLTSNQEGLALKTYQSDLLNNWISTEWIDGDNGINDITRIDTTDGGFTIDELQLSKKIYDMLNRIAISGGSYDDWLDATYTHERMRSSESPIYMGGLIKELSFQEVISNSASEEQPLGTLAGRGTLTDKHKGGHIHVKVDEPSYIMGIVSITPRLDYSQGNKWDVNLKTMDDFHKPALDEIGFQDLITDQMAFWDTDATGDLPNQPTPPPIFKSAGKQPAWINYMTNINQVRGNFAKQADQMFMVLARRYTPEFNSAGIPIIKDLTTYIDPVKFNHIFSYTRRDAQNFWVQIKADITARRKMSAKVMPNL